MEGTTTAMQEVHAAATQRDERRPAAASRTVPKTDSKELRRVLRSVKKIAGSDGSTLWQPVAPGGPRRYDLYQEILLNAFRDQLPGSIRRLKASKPIAVKTRKVVAAMLTLNRFDPEVPAL